ncbi:hypothetical protein WA026_004715 [Henosepilachna vigintioctopunctata]|uniref:Histone H2A/H2B/H3 domain-containing protein n=1 Tax=Henosepilachna vigintioctopunctata TaxID=420089 RepID=A0AAW1V9M8_9CUCU
MLDGAEGTSTSNQPSNIYSNRYGNVSDVCRIKSKRKSSPRKSTSKSGTKLYVQKTTTLVNVLGENRRINLKLLKNMKFLYKSVLHIIPKYSFTKAVEEVLLDHGNMSDVSQFSSTAYHAIQEAAEMYLIYINFLCTVMHLMPQK